MARKTPAAAPPAIAAIGTSLVLAADGAALDVAPVKTVVVMTVSGSARPLEVGEPAAVLEKTDMGVYDV